MHSGSVSPIFEYLRDGVFQLSYVTDDFERGLEALRAKLGDVGFTVIDPCGFEDLVYRGQPVEDTLTAAVAFVGDKVVELAQRTSGPSPYADSSDAPGLLQFHHVGVRVPDLEACRKALAAHELEPVFTGRYMDTRFFYVDCRELLGHWVEFIQFGDEGNRVLDQARGAAA
jgi:hypothetical protein